MLCTGLHGDKSIPVLGKSSQVRNCSALSKLLYGEVVLGALFQLPICLDLHIG